MKKLCCVLTIAVLLLSLPACGARSRSQAFYEFACTGDMTLTSYAENPHDAPIVLNEADVSTLIRIWGEPWVVGSNDYDFDYAFSWENTVIRYCSKRGVFCLGDSKQILKLSDEHKDAVECILHAAT